MQLIPPPANKQLSVHYRPIYQNSMESLSMNRMKVAKASFGAMPQSAPMMEMELGDAGAVASVQSVGDMGVSYLFQPSHKSTIISKERKGQRVVLPGYHPVNIEQSSKVSSDRIFVNSMTTKSRVFTYAVPSSSQGAYLRSWGTLPTGSDAAPLLSSQGARIFLQGQYLGTLNIESTQPGGKFKFELGQVPDQYCF